MRLDAYAAWRAVLVSTGDPAIAGAVAGTEPRSPGDSAGEVIALLEGAERRRRSAGDIAVIDLTSIDGLDTRHRRTLDRLMDLEPADRQVVAAHLVAGIPIDRLESLLPGARQRLARLEPALGEEPETAPAELAHLTDLRPVETAADRRPSRWAVPAMAAILTVAVGAAAAIGWAPAVPSEETASATTMPIATLTTTTTAPDLARLVTDPNRRVHVEMTPDYEVVRRLPGTGEVIWTAGPFRDAEVIGVELDTVVIHTGVRRLKLSLVDGTLLPP